MIDGNSRFNKEVLKTLGLVVMALTIVVQSFLKSDGNSKLADEVKANRTTIQTYSERIARLEECIIALRPLPQEVASIKATVTEIQKTLDRGGK